MLFFYISGAVAGLLLCYCLCCRLVIFWHAQKNLRYNIALEEGGAGVTPGCPVFAQNGHGAPSGSGYRAGEYRFGFARFRGVGCEAASVYNALLSLGRGEPLSRIIYEFERRGVINSPALGFFGSDPFAMARVFRSRGIRYRRFFRPKALAEAADRQSHARVVLARWNRPFRTGFHTFFVERDPAVSPLYRGFNFRYRAPRQTVDLSSLASFNDGCFFIVGYLLEPDEPAGGTPANR